VWVGMAGMKKAEPAGWDPQKTIIWEGSEWRYR
jgi:hypothetical protein